MIRGFLGLKKRSKSNTSSEQDQDAATLQGRASLDFPTSSPDTRLSNDEGSRPSLDPISQSTSPKRKSFLSFRRSIDKTPEHNNKTVSSSNSDEPKKSLDATPNKKNNKDHKKVQIQEQKDDSDDSDNELNNIIESQLQSANNGPIYYSSYSVETTEHTSMKAIKPFKYISIGEIKLLNIKEGSNTPSNKSELYIVAEMVQDFTLTEFTYKLPLMTKHEFLEWKDFNLEFIYNMTNKKSLMRSSYSIRDLSELENSPANRTDHFDNLIIPSKQMVDDLTKNYISIKVFEKEPSSRNDILVGFCCIDLFTIALHPLIDFIGVSLTKDEKTLETSDYIISFSISTSLHPPTKSSNSYWYNHEDSLIIQGQYISPFPFEVLPRPNEL
ncbi:hypothetical protein FDP41_009994 [Naegleria fowleri]|uniref:Uncharacterized protein n=1 Tax=Naegleria fowleri TaxID=5763 RepID=A0A6A5BA09_NAEFO|nr:uncharacterized protein FDP41_009994 [Naegleria fowleri]KAF0971771.1 hypothetical protein FDP41_009994 [Naegleria fowleri]CAG4708769.1 unnamed protein product [Naegleria fowleri]